jgi:uncharacterized cupredoxin-like copper-binding protein
MARCLLIQSNTHALPGAEDCLPPDSGAPREAPQRLGGSPMKNPRKILFAFAGLAALALAAASPANAATTVKVSLWDKGADMAMPTDLLYATPGIDLTKATMGITAEPATAKPGVVSFHVTNDSKDTVHEMIVMYLDDPTKPLPYLADENRVDEDKAGDKGEVSELEPGASGSLTVTLKAGTYLLICNVAGHYAAGMWTVFTVAP